MHNIRNPKRSASASIAGHRYAFVCIAQKWLDLDPHSFCVVEGNEDADVVTLRPGRESNSEIQYKHHSKPFGPRNRMVREAIVRFLTAWSTHRAANREFRGVFQTTARFSEQSASAVGNWIHGTPPDEQALRLQITKLLRQEDHVPDALLREIESDDGFRSFINSVVWRTNSPGQQAEYRRLLDRLQLLVPDLDPAVAGKVLVAQIIDVASAPSPEQRTLTYMKFWETVNDATLSEISSTRRGSHSIRPIVDVFSSNNFHAACLLLADSEQIRVFDQPNGWATLSPSDLATDVYKSLDFACYVAICKKPEGANHCRERVLRQCRFAYPRVRVLRDETGAAASTVAREVAKRSIEFEMAGCSREPLAPFISKVRWLRLSSGRVLTAGELLTVPKTV